MANNILTSTCDCKKCNCNPNDLKKFEYKDGLLISENCNKFFSFEYYARLILDNISHPNINDLLIEKKNEPDVKEGNLFICKRDDNQKGGKNYCWNRSNDRSDCKKLDIGMGFLSVNLCKTKPEYIEKLGSLKKYRYALHSTNNNQIEIVLIHIISETLKSCRCGCHRIIPFKTRKRKIVESEDVKNKEQKIKDDTEYEIVKSLIKLKES
jgi:hypothetical protein